MSKLIRLTDGTYIVLEAIRRKRESFSEAVERLIKVYLTIKEVSDTLGPGHYLKERSPHQEAIERLSDRRTK